MNNWVQDTPVRSNYYRYHHTAGDSMTIMNSDDMDSNVVGIAAFLFILADLEVSIRDINTPLIKNLRFDYKFD